MRRLEVEHISAKSVYLVVLLRLLRVGNASLHLLEAFLKLHEGGFIGGFPYLGRILRLL